MNGEKEKENRLEDRHEVGVVDARAQREVQRVALAFAVPHVLE